MELQPSYLYTRIENLLKMLTIVIPTYNRLDFLIKAYESVLQQDSNEYILYILDDSTNLKTYNFFQNLKLNNNVFYIKNINNLGIVRNISNSFSMAKTKWVTMMSDDDIMEPNFVSESLKILRSTKRALVISSFRDIDKDGVTTSEYIHKPVSINNIDAFISLFYDRFPTAGGSGFFLNTRMCKDILYFKEYPRALLSDTYLCLSAAEIGGLETIDKILYSRRRWDGSLSSIGKSPVDKMKSLYYAFSAHRMFSNDLLNMWTQLMKCNNSNVKLIEVKHDVDKYCRSNPFFESLKFKLVETFE